MSAIRNVLMATRRSRPRVRVAIAPPRAGPRRHAPRPPLGRGVSGLGASPVDSRLRPEPLEDLVVEDPVRHHERAAVEPLLATLIGPAATGLLDEQRRRGGVP